MLMPGGPLQLLPLLVLLACHGTATAPAAFPNRRELRAAVIGWRSEARRSRLISTYGSIEVWDVSGVTSMRELFSGLSWFNESIGAWDTSAVTDMRGMFSRASAFNQPIGSWNTSAVTSMRSMFEDAKAFNQPIGSWNTSAVTDMRRMFAYAQAFNQPIGTWNTAAVTTMALMFRSAEAFDHPIGSWNTRAVTDMSYMFLSAYAFNQPIGFWNTSAVTNMRFMFDKASNFDQPIGSWNTSSVSDMAYMFSGAHAFNQPLGSWNTSAVTDMAYMFSHAKSFDQPIGSWNTAAVKKMTHMFEAAVAFNQPLGSWNTAAVNRMDHMFDGASVFDQPIGPWNTSAVTTMQAMFYNAKAFDRPIGVWNTSSLKTHDQMFHALTPPCKPGRGPGRNQLMCERCGVGQYAPAHSFCQGCPEGAVPSDDRGTCVDCPTFHFSVTSSDKCVACDLPLALVDNNCIWWHLPLGAVCVTAVAVAARLLIVCIRVRKAAKVARLLEDVYDALWDEEPTSLASYTKKLLGLGFQDASQSICEMRALQSQRAGVGIAYLLSPEFAQLAQGRSKKDDPTFIDSSQALGISCVFLYLLGLRGLGIGIILWKL